MKLNKFGFRDSEISPKHPKEYRILIVGDSNIYGQGVDEKVILTSVLEQALNKTDSSCQFNVINMGVRAYSTNNEMAMLKKMGFSLDPDHIIIFFFINDFIPDDIERRYKKFATMDWYTFDFSDKPTDRIIEKWKLREFLRKSAFLMWGYDIYRDWTNRRNYIIKMLRGELDFDMQNNIESTIKSLEEIRVLSEKHEVKLTLAVIPLNAPIKKVFPNQIYQTTMKKYAVNSGIDFVDLLPDLRSHYEQHQDSLVIPFDGHYNGRGHRVMANSIFDYLSNLDLCHK